MTSLKPYTGSLKAVIFDWAGTTIDYGCFAPVAVFIEVFKRRGVAISIAQARAPMGLEKRDHIQAITQQPEVMTAWEQVHRRLPNKDDIDHMYRDSLDIQKAAVTDYAELIPGTLSVVSECRERGLKIGSSTGYSQSIMDALVPVAKAQDYKPNAIVCPSHVPSGRPAPFMIYQNAIQLNVYPMASLVKVGDTLPDIGEGLSAGTWVVAVTQSSNELGMNADDVSAMNEEELSACLAPIETRFRKAGAHYVIRTIADLCPVLDDIENRLRSGERP